MNIDLTNGQPLVMQWELPFTDLPIEQLHLDLGIDYIEFSRDGSPIGTFSRQTTPDAMRLEWHAGKWLIRFVPADYSVLTGGPVTYECVVLRMDNETPLIQDSGMVTIHG